MQSLMETTRMVRRPYLSARMPQMEEDSSMPRNTTVVSVACWYSGWMEQGFRTWRLFRRCQINSLCIGDLFVMGSTIPKICWQLSCYATTFSFLMLKTIEDVPWAGFKGRRLACLTISPNAKSRFPVMCHSQWRAGPRMERIIISMASAIYANPTMTDR